jgi:hypothetical protein
MYNLYSILKTSEHDVLLVRRLHPVSPALLPSGHGFGPYILHRRDVPGPELQPGASGRPPFGHLLHQFLTFYADLIKWSDTNSRPACRAWPGAAAHVPGPELQPRASGRPPFGHLLHQFLTFYDDLIKWSDGLTGWSDTDSRSVCRA